MCTYACSVNCFHLYLTSSNPQTKQLQLLSMRIHNVRNPELFGLGNAGGEEIQIHKKHHLSRRNKRLPQFVCQANRRAGSGRFMFWNF